MSDDSIDFDEQPTPDPARAPIVLTDSRSRKRGRSLAMAHGVPAMTETLQLLVGGQRTPEDEALIAALRESADVDPYVMGVTLANVIVANRKSDRSGSEEAARLVAVAVKDQDDRLKAIERRNKFWDKVLWVAAIAVAGSLVAVADRIWARSASETAMEYRMRAVEREHEHERPHAPQKDEP